MLGFRNSSLAAAFSQPIRPFMFLLQYLGSPFTVSPNLATAAAAGSVGLLLAVALCGRYLLRPDRLNRFRIAHLTIIAFILLSGAATSVARFAAPEATPLSSRYTTAAFIFWACTLSLLLYEASQWPRVRKALGTTVVCIILIVVAISIVPLHLAFGAWAKEAKRAREESGLALVVGIQNEQYLKELHPRKTKEVISMVPLLREKRLSMFNREWAHYVGKNMSSLFIAAESNVCVGQFRATRRLRGEEGSAQSGVRAFGWAWDMQAEKPCPLVLIVDNDGVVRGIARTGYHLDNPPPLVKNESARNSGWSGYATYEKGLSLYAFALSADKSVVCRLRGVRSVKK
jgi:hypothetical protein